MREDYDSIKDTLFNTSELEAEHLRMQEEMNVVAELIGQFVSCLEQMDGPLTAFREDNWYSLVVYATVYSREDIRFTFKNGMEIKV